MDVILMFFLAAIGTWLFWRILKFVQRYKTFSDIFKSKQVQSPGSRHLIWGHLHMFKDLKGLFTLLLQIQQQTKAKLLGFWVMFFYPIFAVSHPDTVKILLKSSEPKPKHFGGGYHSLLPWLGDGLLLSDGKKWHRNRRLLTPAFHYDILRPYVQVYNEVADIFLGKLSKVAAKDVSIEIFEPVAMATLDTMLRCAFSYEEHVQELGTKDPYVTAVQTCARLSVDRTLKPWQFYLPIYKMLPSGKEFMKATDFIHKYDEEVIAKRRAELIKSERPLQKRKLDFLDILLTVKDENGVGLSDKEIRDEVDTFLFEGHDTTTSAISWAIYALAKYPKEQQKVYEEVRKVMKNKTDIEWSDLHDVPVMTAFIKETLRMYPAVPGISRITTDYTLIDGVMVPPNTEIYILIYLLNMNPDVWPDYQEFRPDRFLDSDIESRHPYSYVPFSAGPRNCIGQLFAMNEIKVMLAKLINRICEDSDHVTDIFPELTLRSTNGIKVRLQRYENI